jgi:hypothetical protein
MHALLVELDINKKKPPLIRIFHNAHAIIPQTFLSFAFHNLADKWKP